MIINVPDLVERITEGHKIVDVKMIRRLSSLSVWFTLNIKNINQGQSLCIIICTYVMHSVAKEFCKLQTACGVLYILLLQLTSIVGWLSNLYSGMAKWC